MCGNRFFGCVLCGLLIVVAGTLSVSAQIPTQEERIRESSFNPEYVTWRAAEMQLPPASADDWPQTACYRKDLTLPAAPRSAGI